MVIVTSWKLMGDLEGTKWSNSKHRGLAIRSKGKEKEIEGRIKIRNTEMKNKNKNNLYLRTWDLQFYFTFGRSPSLSSRSKSSKELARSSSTSGWTWCLSPELGLRKKGNNDGKSVLLLLQLMVSSVPPDDAVWRVLRTTQFKLTDKSGLI